jgi:hypothetical protein
VRSFNTLRVILISILSVPLPMIQSRILQLNPNGIAHSHVVQSLHEDQRKGRSTGALSGGNV